MKSRISGFVFWFIICGLFAFVFYLVCFFYNFVKLQVVEYDAKFNQTRVVEEFNLSKNQSVKLDEYNGNEITIKKVSLKGVVISRRYKISEFTPAPEGMYGGSISTHYEEIEEYIPFDEEFEINKDVESSGDGLPALEQARFSYTLKFVKELG